MLFTHPMMKLGKRAPRLDPRTLRLSKYLKTNWTGCYYPLSPSQVVKELNHGTE